MKEFTVKALVGICIFLIVRFVFEEGKEMSILCALAGTFFLEPLIRVIISKP